LKTASGSSSKTNSVISAILPILRIPKISHSQKMGQKSQGWVIGVDLQDPSSHQGVIEVMKGYIKYVPVTSACGNVRRKIPVFGK
jgi:hypothetical protein